MEKNYNSRFIIVFFLFLAVVTGFIVKLYYMQIVNGEDYLAKTEKNIPYSYDVAAIRGDIMDRNGIVLAYNVESYDLYMNKSYKTTAELNAACLLLVDTLDSNQDDCVNHLDAYFDFENMQFNSELTEEEIATWQINEDLFNISDDKIYDDPVAFYEKMRSFFKINETFTSEQAYKIMIIRYELQKNRWYWWNGQSLMISRNVSLETMAIISEQKHLLQGITLRPSMTREYGDVKDIAHVLGYVGLVTPDDVTEDGYKNDAFIGKTGVEDFAEDLLKGSNGNIAVISDSFGNIISKTGGESAVDGNDVYVTIDMNLQKIAMESLVKNIEVIKSKAKENDTRNFADANAGAVVVLDVKTGEVLVMASYPTYDPNWFIHSDEESEKQKMLAIFDNEGKPLLNRALQETYTPGSAFKPIVAISGLEEEVITKETEIYDPGHKVIGDWDFYCLEYVMSGYTWTHEFQNVVEAIKTSCNMFFYILGTDTGIDAIDKWGTAFGLGEKTGIDLYGEATGIRSNREYKYEKEFEKWYIADTAQSSIGQLYHNYTPLQLANYTAALANGGKVFTPYVIKKAMNANGEIVYEGQTSYTEVPWSEETFEVIREGMGEVTYDGTASGVFEDYPINVAGKTGTAETGREAQESSNGVFICYAPIEDPEIAIAVVIEHGVWGSYTAPIAKDILSEYFGLNYDN
jgi:penicillin-binding protein 2